MTLDGDELWQLLRSASAADGIARYEAPIAQVIPAADADPVRVIDLLCPCLLSLATPDQSERPCSRE